MINLPYYLLNLLAYKSKMDFPVFFIYLRIYYVPLD